ncbi:putative leucine-rich repeat extensin-like protein 7 [Iris pallida]|uniref:Leucine-rich repeat extensin-like protein 7 n=1 Tax=Iris pallida TaxID=29817 RepID=A0AAX6IFH3_IRIPA|nr:putative leucine-rich repeat extensin-like protein 7 [Iris pallida]
MGWWAEARAGGDAGRPAGMEGRMRCAPGRPREEAEVGGDLYGVRACAGARRCRSGSAPRTCGRRGKVYFPLPFSTVGWCRWQKLGVRPLWWRWSGWS